MSKNAAIEELTEKQVAAQVDAFAHALGYKIIRMEQRRASKIHLGTPDRRYQGPRACFFFEIKRPSGRLTREQSQFLQDELEGGALASCGGLKEFRELTADLMAPTQVGARNACLAHLRAWRDRGYRGEKKGA